MRPMVIKSYRSSFKFALLRFTIECQTLISLSFQFRSGQVIKVFIKILPFGETCSFLWMCPWNVFPLSWKLKGVYIELSCVIFYEYDDMNILLKNYFRFVRRPPTKRLRARNNFYRVRSSELSLTGAMKNADDRNFCLADYDAIGFDLDNTLAKYKLVNLMNVRVPIIWLISFYLVCEKHVIILLSVSYETWSMFFFLLQATTV